MQEEYEFLKLCNEYLPPKAFQKGFVLTYDRMRRYEGKWHSERKLLFPAYVFLESKNGEILAEEVNKCSCFRENELFTVDRDEEKFLRKLCGESGNINMSTGIICQGVPRIIRGPLKGMEKQIRKINRHKRLAKVETKVDFMKADERLVESRKKCLAEMHNSGRPPIRKWGLRYITAGLEITEKITKEK